jgi:hypothetical protein
MQQSRSARGTYAASPDEVAVNAPATAAGAGSARNCLRTALVREPVLFALLVLLYLLPVCVFPYVPTQDGPSHVANAIILKDFHRPEAWYRDHFELRWEPFPNWTSHALLAGLLFVVPPLVAEKALVSLYVVGFAGSFRYFLGAFGPAARLLAPAALLFLYNRCFLMGFYNFCLSLALFWLGLGYALRRRDGLEPRDAAVFMTLFTAGYFTQLLGFLLLLAGTVWLVVAASKLFRSLLWLGAAALPSLLLTTQYFLGTGFFAPTPQQPHSPSGLALLGRDLGAEEFWNDLDRLNEAFFAPYEGGTVPLGAVVLTLLVALALVCWLAPRPQSLEAADAVRPAVALLAVFLGLLYFVVPNHLGAHGSILKPRLILLCPLLGLAALRLPASPVVRRAVALTLGGLLAVNLVLLFGHFRSANREIEEYTAGLPYAGTGRTVEVVRPPLLSRPWPDPLWHAADYYCLTTSNVNLDNYEATTSHFPVRFRRDAGPQPGGCGQLLLIWDSPDEVVRRRASGWRECYRGGRLTVLTREESRAGTG